MRRAIPLCILSLLLIACSPEKPAPEAAAPKAAAQKAAAKSADHSRYFPMKDRGDVATPEGPLFGHAFLSPGQVAAYKSGKKEYQLFLARTSAANVAAVQLFDYKAILPDAKFVAHFGGYFGADSGTPVFVFTKGPWVAGVRGLPMAEADTVARDFAARLPAE